MAYYLDLNFFGNRPFAYPNEVEFEYPKCSYGFQTVSVKTSVTAGHNVRNASSRISTTCKEVPPILPTF